MNIYIKTNIITFLIQESVDTIERRKWDISVNKINISSLAIRNNTSFKIKNHGADKTITTFIGKIEGKVY